MISKTKRGGIFLIDKFSNVINKLAIALDFSLVYFSPVGIKYFNPPISRSIFDYFILGNKFELSIDRLLIGPDNLKDKYTLLGTPISKSPYIGLMQFLNTSRDIKNIEYLERVKKGTLDIRRARSVDNQYIRRLYNKFESKKSLIQKNTYVPIKCVLVDNEYYIADGKHTAALCEILDITPKCVDVTPLMYDSWFLWLYNKMQKKPNEFRKHLVYFGKIFKSEISKWNIRTLMR